MGLRLVKKLRNFTETGGSLPSSQQRVTCPYPVTGKSSPRPPSYFRKIHFNIALLYVSQSSKWSPFLTFPHQNPLGIFLISQVRHVLPSHPPLFDHPNVTTNGNLETPLNGNKISEGEQIIKYLIMHFPRLL